jgi:hypothetical protein
MPLPKDPQKAELTRKRMRESHLGKVIPEEQRRKMGDAQKGRKHSPETIQKLRVIAISQGRKPPAPSEAFLERLRERMRGDNNPAKHPEAREKISERNTGKNNPHFGKHPSEETRRKLSAARKGKHPAPESCLKISRALEGDKNRFWKGGISFEPYCPKFNREFKERVRLFFGRICIECGSPENGKAHCVHHVNFNKMSCCDDTPPLFVPLCRFCHSKTNFNREEWENHFTHIITQYYGGRCYLTKEEYTVVRCVK